MKGFALILLFFIGVKASPAQSRSVYIQIDTLTNNLPESLFRFDLRVANQGFLGLGDDFDSTAKRSYSQVPAYSNVLFLESNTSFIEVPIDAQGGKIAIEGGYGLDSIIINKIEVFDIQSPDTTRTRISQYKKVNGELAKEPFDVEIKVKTEKLVAPPEQVELIINGKSYQCSLRLIESPDEIVTHGHGYKPKKHLNRRGEDKKKLTYLVIVSRTKKYYWEGNIQID